MMSSEVKSNLDSISLSMKSSKKGNHNKFLIRPTPLGD